MWCCDPLVFWSKTKLAEISAGAQLHLIKIMPSRVSNPILCGHMVYWERMQNAIRIKNIQILNVKSWWQYGCTLSKLGSVEWWPSGRLCQKTFNFLCDSLVLWQFVAEVGECWLLPRWQYRGCWHSLAPSLVWRWAPTAPAGVRKRNYNESSYRKCIIIHKPWYIHAITAPPSNGMNLNTYLSVPVCFVWAEMLKSLVTKTVTLRIQSWKYIHEYAMKLMASQVRDQKTVFNFHFISTI